MGTCYEHIRKKPEDKQMFNRLSNYLKAVDQDKEKEYHEKHGRK